MFFFFKHKTAYELRISDWSSDVCSSDLIFTLALRPGHRWSDGQPFTTEDFRFWWEDVANNVEINPRGLPQELLVEGQPPTVEILDATHVRFAWPAPNARFLPDLAADRKSVV